MRSLIALILLCLAARAEPATRLRFVFITTCVEESFFKPVEKGMRDAAAMLDVDCTFTGTTGVNVRAQAEMVRQAVKDGYDGIALNIIDPTAFDAAVQEAVAAGVPVVAFNVDDQATPNARLAAVNQRLYDAGKTLGRACAPRIAEKSHILSPEILRLLKQGTLCYTVDQQPYTQGFYPVVQLTLYRRYGLKPSDMDAGAALLTAQDAERVMQLSRQGYR